MPAGNPEAYNIPGDPTSGIAPGADLGMVDPLGMIQNFFPGLTPDVVTPEFIEQLTLGISLMNAVSGIKQIEIQGQRLGLEQQQIENEKARLIFEMQELLPFEKQKLQFQERMQQYQLQESQIGLDIARERSLQAQEVTAQSREGTLQAQEGTLQAREGTQQAQLATRRAELSNAAQYFTTNLARSQSTGRNFTGRVSSRPFMGGF